MNMIFSSGFIFDSLAIVSNGRLTRLVDDRGGVTTWSYDTLDRQTVMTFHDGPTRVSTYDEASDLTGYSDENGSSFVNTFDVLGRKTAVVITRATGVGGTDGQSFQYDGVSRMTFGHDNGTPADSTFVFDSLSRVLEEVQRQGGLNRHVTHDAWTSLTSTRLTYPEASPRQVTTGYDLLYRKNSISETSGGANIATWQFFGSRTATVTLGNGITCSMMNNAQTNSAVQVGVANPAWGDNTTNRLGYDGNGRMIAKRFLPPSSTTSLVGFTTSYDPSSNKLFERALHAESRSALYPGYDSMDRLVQYQRGVLASGGASITTPITLPGTNSQRTYNLDGLGNWKNTVYTPEGGSPTTEIRQHNKLNEITQFGSTPVLYDHGNNAGNPNPLIAQRGNGNIADDGTYLFIYDALNRLVHINDKSTGFNHASYYYDVLGRRIQTNAALTSTLYYYLYDGQQIIDQRFNLSHTTSQFVWGQYIDELIQIQTAGMGVQPLPAGNYYPLQDLLYRTTALSNSSAAIVEAYDYDAYGNTLIFSAAGTGGNWWEDNAVTATTPACQFLFTGRQYDPETGNYWYRARYYSPQLGRFITRDPVDYYGGMNLYNIVENAVIRDLDPMGLVAPTFVAKKMGGEVGGAGGGGAEIAIFIIAILAARASKPEPVCPRKYNYICTFADCNLGVKPCGESGTRTCQWRPWSGRSSRICGCYPAE